MDFLGLLNGIYTKEFSGPIDILIDESTILKMNKYFAKKPEYLKSLKQCFSYLFFIEPKHYFYLIFFLISKQNYMPRLPKYEKDDKEKLDPLLEKIRYFLQWTKKELKAHMFILEKTILTNRKYWEKELGVK